MSGSTRARGHPCGLGLLLRIGGFAAAGLRRRADEAGQVIEVQALGFQRRGQPRTVAAHLELKTATEVAVAHLAGEAVVTPDVVVALQASVQRVGRGRRNGDAEQWVEIGQVLATERELQVEHAQLERIGQRAAGHRVGGAGAAVEVDAERVVAVGQFQR